MAGLFVGGVAVFTSGNQAGTVALLAVGSVASLLAVVGKVPLRWVIGGHEIDMSEEAAQDAAEAVASRLSPSETAELAGRLAQLDNAALSPMATAMQAYVGFEQLAIGKILQAIASNPGWTYEPSQPGGAFDAFVVDAHDHRVPVEYKMLRSPAALRKVLDTLPTSSAFPDVVLVLSGQPIKSASFEGLIAGKHAPRVLPVFIDDPGFDLAIVAALEAAFHSAPDG